MARPAELPAGLAATATVGAGARLYAEVLGLPVLDGDYPSVAGLAGLARDRVLAGAPAEAADPALPAPAGRGAGRRQQAGG